MPVPLTTEGHEAQIYTLSGPEALTCDEVADELSRALGRVIRHVSLTPDALRAGMLAEGMTEADRASAITRDVKRATGRAPTRFADYARAAAGTGVWNVERPAGGHGVTG